MYHTHDGAYGGECAKKENDHESDLPPGIDLQLQKNRDWEEEYYAVKEDGYCGEDVESDVVGEAGTGCFGKPGLMHRFALE